MDGDTIAAYPNILTLTMTIDQIPLAVHVNPDMEGGAE